MGKSESKPASKAEGDNSNANSNSVNIYETINEHKNFTVTILLLILAVLLVNAIIKCYNWHKSSIKRAERMKSRINLNAI